MNRDLFKEPQRQSPIGTAVIFFKNLRIAFNVFLSLIAVQYSFKIDTSSGFFLFSIIIILLIFILISYWQYRRFWFYTEGENFILEKGLLSREKISVAFDRIQSVHIHRNLIQQLLGVVALKIDTAGSVSQEMEIPALGIVQARLIQEFLMEQKADDVPVAEKREEPAETRELLRLSVGDLLKVGLSENHLRTGLILFAVINGYVWQYEDYLLKPFRPFLENYEAVLISKWMILLPIALLLFMVVAVLLSLIQSVLRYYKLQFTLERKGAILSSGLLKRTEYQIPRNKIQYIKWATNPIRAYFGFQTISISQAGSEAVGGKQTLKIPGAYPRHLQAILEEFFPERAGEATTLYAHHFLRRRLILLYGVAPALILSALIWLHWGFFILPLLWMIAVIIYAFRHVPTILMQLYPEAFLLSSGWLFPRSSIVKHYKLQGLRMHQSIFLKRVGLVNLDFYTAAGKLRMWYLPHDLAQDIYNYLLYKIESTNRSWM